MIRKKKLYLGMLISLFVIFLLQSPSLANNEISIYGYMDKAGYNLMDDGHKIHFTSFSTGPTAIIHNDIAYYRAIKLGNFGLELQKFNPVYETEITYKYGKHELTIDTGRERNYVILDGKEVKLTNPTWVSSTLLVPLKEVMELLDIDLTIQVDEDRILFRTSGLNSPPPNYSKAIQILENNGYLVLVGDNSQPNPYFSGTFIDLKETKPFFNDQTLYVPLRYIAEGMGATVDYIKQNQSVILSLAETKVVLKPGSKTIRVNDTLKTADIPILRDDRFYVPLHFFENILGKETVYRPVYDETSYDAKIIYVFK